MLGAYLLISFYLYMLYTIIAYILLLSLVSVLSGVLSALWLPVMIGMNKIGVNRYWSAWSNGIITGSLSIALGWLAFYFLNVHFGWIAGGILLVMATYLGNHRLKTRKDSVLELGFMTGDIGALWIGVWLVNSLDDLLLPVLMVPVVLILSIGIYGTFVRNGNFDFWALVQQHPAAAKAYFFNSQDWVFHNQHNYEGMKDIYERLDYQGPFRHAFDDEELYLYYKGEDINKSQKEFTTALETTLQAVEKYKI